MKEKRDEAALNN